MKHYRKCMYNGKRIRTHRAVAMATLGIVLSADMVVHHKDGNKLNNDPSNLVVMSHSEHSRLHSVEEFRDAKGRFARRVIE